MKYKPWTNDEINFLKESWNKLKTKDIELNLNRSYIAIYSKARSLNLGPNKAETKRIWTKEEFNYLADSWGCISMQTIAKNLDRTASAVQQKATDSGLGPFLEAGEYVTLNQFMNELMGTYVGKQYTIKQWTDKKFPIKTKKVKNCSFKVVCLSDFWDWAEKNYTLIDFSKFEPLVFGKEPKWLEEKRKADIEKAYFKSTPWTQAEDERFKKLLSQYKYTYREISVKLKRTEGALKRRMCDLNIKARPVKMSNHNPWTEKETAKLIELYGKGHTPNTMANYICRSAQSCSGKIERLIKEKVIEPRSEFRKSC
jgi:hypothetical protein